MALAAVACAELKEALRAIESNGFDVADTFDGVDMEEYVCKVNLNYFKMIVVCFSK